MREATTIQISLHTADSSTPLPELQDIHKRLGDHIPRSQDEKIHTWESSSATSHQPPNDPISLEHFALLRARYPRQTDFP